MIRNMLQYLPTKWVAVAAVVGASAVFSSQAQAGFTEIQSQRGRRGDANHREIIEHVYGGNFSRDGVNFSNGDVTATRLDDFGAARTDEIWNTEVVSARAVASFAKKNQTFGFLGGASGGEFNKLFDLSGKRFNVSGSAENVSVVDGAIRFARSERRLAQALSTLSSENRDNMDHVITYQINGAGESPTYLMFWEDLWGRRADWDFNDLVVQVQTSGGGIDDAGGDPVMVPVPPAVWTGLSGLLGLGALGGLGKVRRLVRK